MLVRDFVLADFGPRMKPVGIALGEVSDREDTVVTSYPGPKGDNSANDLRTR